MRVALTLEQCWHPVPGGTAVAAIELARELAANASIDLVGVSARHRHPPAATHRPPVPVRQLPLPRIALYEAWHYARRPSVERATGAVDVIHATGLAFPPRSAPIMSTVHDLAFLTYPKHFSRAGLRFFKRALELTREEADLVLCSSLATLEHCASFGFDRARLRHVPLGVRAVPVGEDEVAAARDRYGLKKPFVLWCGTIEPRKNLDNLLRAFARIEADVELVLVGPKGWRQSVGEVQRVRALGFVPGSDLAALYAGASVFCYPSLLEGFGFPVLEAMAQGTPVVTSLGTSTEELADGAGVLVNPREPESIASGIEIALADTGKLAEAGRRRATEYTWARTAQLVVAAYEEAVSTSR